MRPIWARTYSEAPRVLALSHRSLRWPSGQLKTLLAPPRRARSTSKTIRPLFVVRRPIHEIQFAARTVDNGAIGHFVGALTQGVCARVGFWLAQMQLEGPLIHVHALMVAELRSEERRVGTDGKDRG